jgi:hypothetical protein
VADVPSWFCRAGSDLLHLESGIARGRERIYQEPARKAYSGWKADVRSEGQSPLIDEFFIYRVEKTVKNTEKYVKMRVI